MSSMLYSSGFIQWLNNWYSMIIDISIKGTIFLLLSILINVSRFKISSKMRYSVLLAALNSLILFSSIYLAKAFLDLPTLSTFSRQSRTYLLPISNINGSTSNPSTLATALSNYSSNHPTIKGYIFFIWIIGFILLMGRLFVGFYKLGEIKRLSAVETASTPLYDSIKREMNIRRAIKFYISDFISTPVTYGTIRPVILLPCGFEELHEEHKKLALMHEMYHIKRMDNFIGIISQIVLAIFWFNPLLWIAVKKLRELQEENCDDGVIHFGVKPYIYANFMLDLVRQKGFDKFLEGTVSPMAQKSTVEKRILYILDKTHIRNNFGNKAIKAVVVGVSCLIVLCSFIDTRSIYGVSEDTNIRVLIDKQMVSIHGEYININNASLNEIPIGNPLRNYGADEYLKCSYIKNNAFGGNDKAIQIEKGAVQIDINACADGKVSEIGNGGEYGRYIIVTHKYGFSTVYSNVDKIYVKVGEDVVAGQPIGCTGNNNSLGLQMKYKNLNVDPILFLQAGIKG